jgi:predicted dehydrogenase
MSKKLQLGFIGGGINSAVGRTHKIAAEMDSKFEIVSGAFSRHADINKQTGEEYGLDPHRVYDSWIEFLEQENTKIDAVVVLTPTPTHTEIILKVLEYNIPIICEKSLTANIKDGQTILEEAQKQNAFLVVTYNYTGYPMIREMKYMIESGQLGKVQQIHIEMPQEGFLRVTPEGIVPTPQEWRLSDNEIPTVSLDLGVHLHNMVDFLITEKPISLVSLQNNYGNFKEIVDNVNCIAEYTNNTTCNFWYGKTALGQSNGLKVRVFGDKGSLEWVQLHPEEIEFADNIGNRKKIDKSSSVLQIASQERYSRFKAGHPAGFIEAFANYYVDIALALHTYTQSKTIESEFAFFVEDACQSLQLTTAMQYSNIKKSWITL